MQKILNVFRGAGGLLCLTGALALVFPLASQGQQKCDGASIANGPFQYAVVPGQPTSYTFVGTGGSSVGTAFTVTAPGGGTVFPAQSPGGECSSTAAANIMVFDIEKVVDGSEINVPLDSALGAKIKAAFLLSPSNYTFGIGGSVSVGATISNPDVSGGDYGSYRVTMKAQAIGSGVGVGSGFQFTLNLQAPATCVDTDAPVVSILKPTSSDKTLGNIAVSIQAWDPNIGACPSGLKSLTATVSSAGGAVSNLSIPLTGFSLPAAAGTTVTGTGVFTPTGGAGSSGTTLASAFTASSRSGIGTYTLTVMAQDMAGNTGTASVTFKVNYAAVFTKADVPNGCKETDPDSQNCKAQYQFTVKRASGTSSDPYYSDGAMMYDETVRADLAASGGTVTASHSYGTGDVKLCVQIVSVYQTDFTGTPWGDYVLKVYFTDVDGNPMLQATSGQLTF